LRSTLLRSSRLAWADFAEAQTLDDWSNLLRPQARRKIRWSPLTPDLFLWLARVVVRRALRDFPKEFGGSGEVVSEQKGGKTSGTTARSAQSRQAKVAAQCRHFGVERKSRFESAMSAVGPRRTRRPAAFVSAFGSKAATAVVNRRGS
jgi:hypothetical protein